MIIRIVETFLRGAIEDAISTFYHCGLRVQLKIYWTFLNFGRRFLNNFR